MSRRAEADSNYFKLQGLTYLYAGTFYTSQSRRTGVSLTATKPLL